MDRFEVPAWVSHRRRLLTRCDLRRVIGYTSDLRKPDEFRGSKKHDVQVVVNEEFQAQIDKFGMPLNGTYTGKDSGDTIVKVKTTEFTKQDKDEYGRIVDSKGVKTDYFPQKGDKVRLKIWAREWEPEGLGS